MHFRLFVLLNKDHAQNSQDARSYVYQKLEAEGFTTQGRFSYGVADWYVIGGRWSGELTKLLLDKDKIEAFDKEAEDQKIFWTNGTDKPESLQKIKAELLWSKHFPDFRGLCPVWRNTYESEGFEDDAMIVTKKLWSQIMSKRAWCGEIPKNDSTEDGMIYLDGYNGERLPEEKEAVDKMWIVVVDYHN